MPYRTDEQKEQLRALLTKVYEDNPITSARDVYDSARDLEEDKEENQPNAKGSQGIS